MSIFLLHFHAFLKHSEDPRNKKEALKLISEMESERKCPPTAIATEQPSHPSSLSLSLSLSLSPRPNTYPGKQSYLLSLRHS
jgi:hypothetical protein